jgi:ribosomal protein S6--L-glutamate ligase
MKIGLLLPSSKITYGSKRIIEAAQERGHEIRVINLTECFVKISSMDPQIHYQVLMLPVK